MFRSLASASAAAALAFAAAPVVAQTAPSTGAYGTLGYSHLDNDGDGLAAIQGRLGYKFTPNFGVEGEGAFGVNTDKGFTTGAPLPFEQKIKRSVAVYGVGAIPLTENFELFGRVGYGSTHFKARVPSLGAAGNLDYDDDSVNYGAGAQYFFDGRNGVRADWTRHDYRHDRGKADVFGVSYVRRF